MRVCYHTLCLDEEYNIVGKHNHVIIRHIVNRGLNLGLCECLPFVVSGKISPQAIHCDRLTMLLME